MESVFVAAKDLSQFQNALRKLEQDPAVKGALILMADKDHFSNEEIIPVLRDVTFGIIGGIFPEVIYQGKRLDTGTVVIPLQHEFHPIRIQLSSLVDNTNNPIADAFGEVSPGIHSLLVFFDALAPGKTRYMEALFNRFGHLNSYLGGGAGSLSFQSFPCVLDNEGLHQDAAVAALSSKRMAIGVAHGWHPLTEPMKVTKAEGNKVLSINWQPAFEVYRQVVEGHSQQQFTDSNFFDIAKSYPLGIARIDTERIIRDPFMAEGDAIHIVDVIHEGEFVCIMHGDMDSLLNGAQKAAQICAEKSGQQQSNLFCIDCISRVLYMQEDFQREIDLIAGRERINGALTIGEIANDGEGYLEIFNKTVVVARW